VITHDQANELIEAHRRKASLQTVSPGRWVDYSQTAELWQLLQDMARADFRVKPEPRRIFVPFTATGTPRGYCFSRDQAAALAPECEIVEFVEVLK